MLSPRVRPLHALAILATLLGPPACQKQRTFPASGSTPASASIPDPAPSARRLPTVAGAGATASLSDPASAKRTEPTRLISLPISAYHARITADGDTAYLLTAESAYRLTPGRAPESLQFKLGYGATATRNALIFWSDGALREAPKRGGQPRKLVALATPPQLLLSSGSDIAWIERSADGRFSLESISGKQTRTAYTSPGKIDAASMLSDWIFFVERPSDGEWRIGGVRARGGPPEFTSSRGGRAPSMLVARGDLHYYDGNRREVRRLSPDLRSEETLVSNFVCSPLAVAEQVFCANVQGIFELVPGTARPRALVMPNDGGAVADLAASASHLYWVSDAGADKLQVSALALAESR